MGGKGTEGRPCRAGQGRGGEGREGEGKGARPICLLLTILATGL